MKKVYIPLIAIIVIGVVISIFVIQNMNGCDNLENRERRLREISNLGEVTDIGQEISIGDYIISGYTAKNNRHGLAVFAPTGDGKYKFQTNVNRENDELVLITTNINQTPYNIFWANKANLDCAEITYTVDGKIGETITVDAQDNQIVYTESPTENYNVEYIFVDKNGTRYE
ncbi:MAG: hypothetical protein RR368_05480 [Oscillospiraceae bacterium]